MKYQEAFDLLKELVKEITANSEISNDQNLIEFGLSSIQIMQIANQLRKKHIKVSFAKLIAKPTINAWRELLKTKTGFEEERETKEIQKSDKEPFGLTDVQYAYWVGRQDDQPLGGVGCHAYLEFSGENINLQKMREAWKKLIAGHPMLRAIFTKEGMQQVNEKNIDNEMRVFHLENMEPEVAEEELKRLRSRLSHRKLEIEKGQVIGLALALLKYNKYRLFLDIDLLVADVQSLSIIIRDLSYLYQGKEISGYSKHWNFAQYLENKRIQQNKDIESGKNYWKERIKTLAGAPEIPLQKNPETVKRPHFVRRKYLIKNSDWQNIKEKAARYKATPAMVLLASYATVIERWSKNKKFLINIPLFDRQTEDRRVNDVIADFTNLLLLEVDAEKTHTYLELLQQIQRQFIKDVEYSAYSGVEIQRELAKKRIGESFFAPIVFACNLDTPLVEGSVKGILGELSYMISQTPQVWLDFQVYVEDAGILLCWDCVEDLFPEKMIDSMFDFLKQIINLLVQNEEWNKNFDLCNTTYVEKRIRDIINIPMSGKGIHEGFWKYANKYPDDVALVNSENGQKLTYGELKTKVLKMGGLLKNVKKGSLVAITLPRGIEQVIAILGVLSAGNAYIPVGVNQPIERRKIIYEKMNIEYTITSREYVDRQRINLSSEIFFVEDMEMEEGLDKPIFTNIMDTAYVIMTSGSTGEPKGVEVSHFSAWNTIEDINERYDINRDDSILMVSAIDFDLSVYDMFGILAAGGTVYTITDERFRDARYWLKTIKKYNISVWNSVPILLDMLITIAEGEHTKIESLKKVMLSGDWIGLDIPERLKKIAEESHLYAMGGATEGSIWSNYYEVKLPLDPTLKSIPYGYPLKNQVYRVVDKKGQDCPEWVPGELWIGGWGVVKGYKNDAELTETKFIWDKNMRWYRTGDMGRFLNNGSIEFLGRMDFQVKLKGHRIELGEIESALTEYKNVSNAIVVLEKGNKGSSQLVAAIVPKVQKNEKVEIQKNEIKDIDINVYDQVEIEEEYDEDIWRYVDSLSLSYIQDMLRALHQNTVELSDMKSDFVPENMKGLLYHWGRLLENKVKEEHPQYEDLLNIDMEYTYKGNYKNYKKINEYFKELKRYGIRIVDGSVNPLEAFYIKESCLEPSYLAGILPETETIQIGMGKFLEFYTKKKGKVSVLDYCPRDIGFYEKNWEKDSVDITYADTSLFFINQIKSKNNKVKGEKCTISDLIAKNRKFDIVLFRNSLHREIDIIETLKSVKRVLRKGGILIINENVTEETVQWITAGYLEAGFENYQDFRKDEGHTISKENWKKVFQELGYRIVESSVNSRIRRQQIFFAVPEFEEAEIEENKLVDYLTLKLPSYMMPGKYLYIPEIPLTNNGKPDRKALVKLAVRESNSLKEELFENISEVEILLLDIWKEAFKTEEITVKSNYFELGGDSLIAVKIIAAIKKKLATEIQIRSVFENPTIQMLSKSIQRNKTVPKEIEIEHQEATQYELFPLTSVQYAYWIGRQGVYSVGDVSTHVYFEISIKNIDIDRMEVALNKVIKQRGMMKAIITEKGEQVILREVPKYKIPNYDLKNRSFAEIISECQKIREEMAQEVITIEQWPPYDIRVALLPQEEGILYIGFDNLILDGASMFQILDEWSALYRQPNIQLKEEQLSFRDYVLWLERMKMSERYEKDKQYWQSRITGFFKAPDLPVKKNKEEKGHSVFHRRQKRIESETWNSIKGIAQKYGMTPTAVILGAYSEVLCAWSETKQYTINVTQFNRMNGKEELNNTVGDYTILNLLEVNSKKGGNFKERVQNIQRQLSQDMEHQLFSGVELLREINRESGSEELITMPVVFTSGLGMEEWSEKRWFGNINYNVSQTPQVWLDHQIIEIDGDLMIMWDSLDALFEEGTLDDMFTSYVKLIQNISESTEAWENEKSNITIYDKAVIKNCETREIRGILEKFNAMKDTSYAVDEIEVMIVGSTNEILPINVRGKIAIYIPQTSELFVTEYMGRRNKHNELVVEHELKEPQQKGKIEGVREIRELTDVEERIKTYYEKILQKEISNTAEDFFKLGGDSLQAMQLITKIEKEEGIKISMSDFFEESTIHNIAQLCVKQKTTILPDSGEI